MRTTAFLLILFCLAAQTSLSQSPKLNWALGDSLLIQIPESGSPTIVRSIPMYALEASSTLSNSAGQLLAYSNASGIWNANDSLMQGWHLIEPVGSMEYGSTITQGALFVPQPGDNEERYYWLILCSNEGSTRIYASLIDMELDGGLGGVVDSLVNIPIMESAEEHLHAVRHTNEQDWWIYSTAGSVDSARLVMRTKLSSDGFGPVLYSVLPQQLNDCAGEMTTSPDGCYMAIVGSNKDPDSYAALLRIDRTSGNLELLDIERDDRDFYGVSFSPDSKLLYVGEMRNAKIFQFSFENDSLVLEYSFDFGWGMFEILANFELADNNRIYFCNTALGTSTVGDYLGAINSPNTIGIGCDIDPQSLYLAGVTGDASGSLPNFANYVYNPGNCEESTIDTITTDTSTTFTQELDLSDVLIYPNPASEILNFFIPNQVVFRYTVIDLTGKQLGGSKLYGEQSVSVDINHFPPAIYFLLLFDSENRVIRSEKFIKQ